MSNNVLLLGAGFSYDAGIPLMSSFVQTMRDMSQRRRSRNGNQALANADQEILDSAIRLLNEIDGYHGRASFNDRNIEDLLSILSFKTLAGGKGSRSSMETLNRAIARTIELTSRVQDHDLVSNPRVLSPEESGGALELYRGFWRGIIHLWLETSEAPTIITLNYDLVLERSLVALMVGTEYGPNEPDHGAPFSSICLSYAKAQDFDRLLLSPRPYQVRRRAPKVTGLPKSSLVELSGVRFGGVGSTYETRLGHQVSLTEGEDFLGGMRVSLLKLHGSLNFPKRGSISSLEHALDDPLIVPPVYSKNTNDLGVQVWQEAMKALNNAKNLVVVGYSLPPTDTYMQYFLKAALGPNTDLNKITVYDPALFAEGARALRGRYASCFSSQLHDRIDFEPKQSATAVVPGSTRQFIHDLQKSPEAIFFK